MSVKKLSFYLDSPRITVRSNHLPLKKFLEKNTMNAKVNNWAVELESQNIDFVFIPGIKNVLADTLSRLIKVDSDVKLPEEKEGEEFGYIPFERLPTAQVETLEEVWINEVTKDKVTIKHEDPIEQNININLPLTNQKMKELQEQDPKVSHLRKLWSESKLNKTLFTMENDILKRQLVVNGLLYKPVVTPSILKECLIMLAHDEQGHNGFKRTYGALQTVYYWKGMKRQIQLHCRRCRTCARHNVTAQEFNKEHFSVPAQSMEFIVMDLIGEFHPASRKGNRYALTAICMLTGFTFCIPLKNKTAEEVVKTYLNHICCVFGPSKKILTDNGTNGTKFKKKMWEDVYKLPRTQPRVTPIYSPQCNGRIEGFHRFLKATVGKQIQKGLEWDDLVWKATSAYNFFPTESSGNSPLFLMFGHEAHNLAKSRTARDGNRILKRKNSKPKHLKPNGLVVVRDHTSKTFEPKAIDHHIVDFCGKNQVLVKDNYGNPKKVHIKDVKLIEMDIATTEFLRKEREQCTTRDAKHVMPIKQIPDLQWEFIESIDLIESDRGVTVYCIKGAEGEIGAAEVTGVSEPEADSETTESTKPVTDTVTTEAIEPVEDTQTTEVVKPVEDANTTEAKEPIERSEMMEVATPRENSENTEDIEHRETMKDAEPTEKADTTQAVQPVENTENTVVSEPVAPEEVEVTETVETVEIAEVKTDTTCTEVPKEIEAVAPRENEEQSGNCSTGMITLPGSPQRDNPKIQNISSEDTTQVETETEQAVQKIHHSPEVNNSLVTKIFSAFRQAKETNSQPTPGYGLQM